MNYLLRPTAGGLIGALPMWLIPTLGAGTVWRHLGERGIVDWAPHLWVKYLFGVAVIAYAVLAAVVLGEDRPPRPLSGPRWVTTACLGFAMCAAAVVLYWPMRRIGLLADDFALLEFARTLDLAPARWEYLRPLGLLTWWAVAQIGGDGDLPVRLHLLNTVMHGANAALVGALALALGKPVLTAAFAAVLFVVWPTVVEPVVWCSAIFDVQLTMLALILCLVALRRQDLRRQDFALCLVLALLMIGTKETGVMAGPLMLLAHWTRWGYNRRAVGLATMLTGLAVGYTLVRHLTGRIDSRLIPLFDGEPVRRLFTQSFGVLFVPLHDDVLNAFPLAGVFVPIGLILLVVIYARGWRLSSEDGRLALFAVGSIVLALAPAITPFSVSGDLQGTRYMYLPSAIWVVALAAALLNGPASRQLRLGRYSVALVTVTAAVVAVTMHFEPWREARRVRDGVLLTLSTVPPSCVRVHARNVPDHVRGAYVFRNGLTEAAASIGRPYEFVRETQADNECRVDLSFTWRRVE